MAYKQAVEMHPSREGQGFVTKKLININPAPRIDIDDTMTRHKLVISDSFLGVNEPETALRASRGMTRSGDGSIATSAPAKGVRRDYETAS